ncbi:2-hydroxyacid dehydrogenase [Parahaliea mediterranea]|uniref:D-glycerate dehydrogenase n=1 Tax=Parahaliea mediterranea TaxID=651086 RepID=A0A939IMM1_9GAMM|nr:D-glycerate dehydrogenase [Parahaliea mediterranea]MBN7797670.1 D-glycerate dehydrogenase [Parahaliea mediterranea]
MSTIKLALATELPPALMEAMAQIGELVVAGRDPVLMTDCTVYVTSPMSAVDASLIADFPDSMGLVASIGVGTDHIDLPAASERGLMVSNTPVVTEDTADLAMALVLATCRRLNRCEQLLRSGDWAGAQQNLGQRVHGKTLGIVGFGDIGQAVAYRAAGFNMNLLYHGPNRKPEAEQATGASYCDTLAQLLAASDIVSLNCPLTDATRHLINAAALRQMKAGAVLINTARGPLVDERALVEALASGHLGAAGLDVFEFEPQVTPALKDFANVTLLPHIGSATGECRTDMALRLLGNIRSYIQLGAPEDRCV